MLRVIFRNAVSNWVGFAVHAAVAFFLTPFILANLGAARYGAWTLIISLTGHYGFLDLGFRAGLTQYLTRYLATGNFKQLNRSASTGFVALACSGALILLGSLGMAWLAPVLFHLPEELGTEVCWALVINGTALALQFPLFTFSAVFTATQRFDLANAIGIATRLATALGTFFCLHEGYGLLGISMVVAAGNLMEYALYWGLAYRILPQLRVSPRLANLRSCWEFARYGIWNMVGTCSTQLMCYSPAIVIGLFLPPAALATYALAASLSGYFSNLFVPLGAVFFPVATNLNARNQTASLRKLYLGGSKLLLVLAIPLGLMAFCWAPDFFRLWIGPHLDDGTFPSPDFLFRILVIGAVCTAGQRLGYQVLLGSLRIKLFAGLFALEALTSITLAVCLVPSLGLTGIALGTLIPAVCFQAVLHPVILTRLLGIPWRTYFLNVCLRPLILAVPLTYILFGVHRAIPVSSWHQLFFLGLAGMAIAAGLVAVIGLDKEERDRFLIRPLFRWISPQSARTRFSVTCPEDEQPSQAQDIRQVPEAVPSKV